jgi:hypothetical protein
MKLPPRVEQGQTEHKGPAPAQVGCSAESRLEQKEGYGWHALFLFSIEVNRTKFINKLYPNIAGGQASSF